MACSHRQKASIAQPVPCKHHLHSPHPALLSQLSPVSSLKAILKSHRRDPLSSILDRSPVLSLTAHHVTLGEFLPSGAQHPHLPRADRLMDAGETFTSDVKVSLDSQISSVCGLSHPLSLECSGWIPCTSLARTLLAVKPTDAGGGGEFSFACLSKAIRSQRPEK